MGLFSKLGSAMPIRVECDNCGAKYNVDERRAGTEIPCKECDADIYVPEAKRGGDRGPRGGSDRGSRGGSPRRERPAFVPKEEYEEQSTDSNPAVFVVCLVAGALVLAGIVFGVMYAMKDDPADPAQVAQNDGEENTPADPNAFNQNAIPFKPNPNPLPQNNQPINQNNNPVNPNPNPIKPNPNPFNRQPIVEPMNPVVQNDPPMPNPMPQGFQPAEGNLPGLPPDLNVDWNVQFDPLTEQIAIEDERKLRVPLPGGVDIQDVLWPATPSFFVAMGNNDNDRSVREVFDIRSRKKVGRIGGFAAWRAKSALSPNGKFFAVSNNQSKGIFVWDVEGSKAKGTLPFPSDWGATSLTFAGTKRLVAAGPKVPLQVWSLPDGNPERTINLPEEVEDKTVACSHGGKYAAVYRKKQNEQAIHFYDLDTGELAGAAGVPLQGGNSFWTPGCHALMFSPDGEELAGLFEETFTGKFLYVFNLKDGEVTFTYKLEDGDNPWWPEANSTPIQWFPHKHRWLLFGNLLLDRKVGKIVWKFSNDQNLAASRRILNDGMMMGAALENGKSTLISFPVEEDKIAKSATTVEAGGELVDVKLPPLTAIDRANVEALTLDVGSPNWTAKPDPTPAGEPLKDTLSVTATGGRMTGLLLSNPAAGQAVIYSELKGPGIPTPRPIPGRENAKSSAFAHLDFYDLRTGKRSDQMDFEFATKLSAFSPSGARVASVIQPDEDRLDIWSAADGKPLFALRPYKDEDKNHKKIQAVAFVDDEHLLTINNQKKLVLWKLPECKAVYEIAEAAQPGLSPNQQYLAVSTGRGYLLLDSRTGNQVGSFNIEGTMHAAAFHPDGTRFAASCTGPKGPSIVVWSMQDGNVLSEFPIQSTAQNMHFCDANHLLINNETLVDVEHELIVWKYRLAGGAHSPQSPDGRHWYIAPKGASGAELIAAKLPEAKVAETLATKTLKPDFLLEPGGKLTVQINLPDAGPGQVNIRQRALENIVAKYQNHGTTVGGGSELIVTMDMKENNTGETQELELTQSTSPFGGGIFRGTGEKITLPLLKIDCNITFTYQGKVLNEQKANFNNGIGWWGSVRIEEGKTPAQQLSENMWNMASSYFTNYGPPVYVFRDFEGKGFGLSVLSDRGPLPQGTGG